MAATQNKRCVCCAARSFCVTCVAWLGCCTKLLLRHVLPSNSSPSMSRLSFWCSYHKKSDALSLTKTFARPAHPSFLYSTMLRQELECADAWLREPVYGLVHQGFDCTASLQPVPLHGYLGVSAADAQCCTIITMLRAHICIPCQQSYHHAVALNAPIAFARARSGGGRNEQQFSPLFSSPFLFFFFSSRGAAHRIASPRHAAPHSATRKHHCASELGLKQRAVLLYCNCLRQTLLSLSLPPSSPPSPCSPLL